MNFATFNAHTNPLFFENRILKFQDIVNLENCIFVQNCLNKNAFLIFSEHFKKVSNIHNYSTRSASKGLLFKKLHKTTRFGINSIANSALLSWNFFQSHFDEYDILKTSNLKSLFHNYFLSTYENQ